MRELNIDKSCLVLSGYLPMTSEEEEAFSFDDTMKTTVILGRRYAVIKLHRDGDGTFTAKMIPMVKL